MRSDPHQRARKLALAARVEGTSEQDRLWLDGHLAECAACAEAATALEAAIGNARGAVVMADARLVRATQVRVRVRAGEMQRTAAAMRPLWIAAAVVVASAIATTMLSWQMVALAAEWFRMTTLSSRLLFAFLWIAPALAASVMLLALGSHRARWTSFALTGISERP